MRLFFARQRGAICNCMKTQKRGEKEDRLNVCTSERRNVGEKRHTDEAGNRRVGGDRIRYTRQRIAESSLFVKLFFGYHSNGAVRR
jgi:hypothetical protein